MPRISRAIFTSTLLTPYLLAICLVVGLSAQWLAIAALSKAQYGMVQHPWLMMLPLSTFCLCVFILALYKQVSRLQTKLYQAENLFAKLAYHAEQLGLDAQEEFAKQLLFAIRSAHLFQQHCALLILDCDPLKQLSSVLSQACVEQLLQEVAKRLRAMLALTDISGRLGEYKFGIILTDFAKVSQVSSLAAKISTALALPLRIQNKEIILATSMGISIFPDDGLSSESLMEHAQMSLYRAKEFGKNNFQFFGGTVLGDESFPARNIE